jgi:hypothetical protein
VTLSSRAARSVLQSLRCSRSSRGRCRRGSDACGVGCSFRVLGRIVVSRILVRDPVSLLAVASAARSSVRFADSGGSKAAGAVLSSSLALLWRIARPHLACRRSDTQLSWTSGPFSTFEAGRSTVSPAVPRAGSCSALRVWSPSRRFSPSQPASALFRADSAHGIRPSEPACVVRSAFPRTRALHALGVGVATRREGAPGSPCRSHQDGCDADLSGVPPRV